MAMMATSEAKECNICKQEFNEEQRCPRILPCYCNLCTHCINQCIRSNEKRCPFCRKGFTATSAQDFRINNSTLELLKTVAYLEKRVTPARKRLMTSHSKRNNDFTNEIDINNENLVSCQNAEDQITFAMVTNNKMKDSILEENLKINNDILVRFREIAANNVKKVEYLERDNKRMESQLREIKEKQKRLQDLKGKLDSTNSYEDDAVVMDEAKETKTDVKRWLQKFKGFISRDEKTRHGIKKIVEKTKDKISLIQEILSCPEEREEDINLLADIFAIATLEDNEGKITPGILRDLSAPVKRLLERGRIFAVQQHEEGRRSAKISITDDNRLCLHHLNMESLPPDVLVVKHSEVLRLVDSSSRLTFLDLVSQESTLGRIYIRLTPNTKGAKHFSILCTGEIGPSYASTSILKVWSKGDAWEVVQCGDYENNDGSGGKALLCEMLKERGVEYKRPWIAGTVRGGWAYGETEGDEKAAQFYITTKDFSHICEPSFGMVENGLQILTEAISHHPDIEEILISDCGIVLPRLRFIFHSPHT